MKILSLDIGSSAVKAAVLDQKTGLPLHTPARVAIEIQYPSADAAELPAGDLSFAMFSAAKQAIQIFGQPDQIDGIGLSCFMPALLLLDENHEPLAPIWMHLDRRSRPIARKILKEDGDDFLREIGNRPLPGGISALCFAQLMQDQPELKPKVRHYLHAHGWLGYLLTGRKAFDVANASFTGVFGTLTTKQWSKGWCYVFGIKEEWLPEVVCGSTTLGGLLPSIATELRLKSGIPIKLGTADTSSGMLAANLQPGDLYVTVGTTTVLARFVDTPIPDERRLTRFYGVGERYIYAAHNPVGGSALPWILELCFHEYLDRRDDFFTEMIPAALKRQTEVQLEPPFLGGDRLQIEPRRASFTNLTLGTERLDLLAAVLSAMQAGYRSAFAALDWPSDQSINNIYLSGGGSEVMKELIPELSGPNCQIIEEGAMRGVARLFDQ
jgi:xylulokinase